MTLSWFRNINVAASERLIHYVFALSMCLQVHFYTNIRLLRLNKQLKPLDSKLMLCHINEVVYFTETFLLAYSWFGILNRWVSNYAECSPRVSTRPCGVLWDMYVSRAPEEPTTPLHCITESQPGGSRPVSAVWDMANGSLTRYVNLRIVHAPGMPGTFSPPPRVSDPGMHHGTCVAAIWHGLLVR